MSPSMDLVLNPPAERDIPAQRQEAARRLLEDVVARSARTRRPMPRGPRPGWRPRPRRTWRAVALAAASTAAAAVLVVSDLGGTGDEVVHAATPPMLDGALGQGEPAEPVLRRLADAAAGSGGQAADATVRTENWELAVSVAGEGAEQRVTTAVVPTLRERTRNDDGSIHLREVRGEPQFPGEAYRRAWDEAGRPDPSGTVLLDRTVPAGRIESQYPADLATAPGPLRAQLLSAAPEPTDATTALFRAVRDVHAERPVAPATRGAELSVLAGQGGVTYLGETTDRADREAVAIAADGTDTGLARRHVLLLDPDDGRVLGYEEILTGDTGALDVDAPAVVAYTVFR
ncbi:hypothetical protein CLV30_11288 [Haloactinopolyspora alba]|uniref:CU044_5270 family protein n=1 Tax=Haloactinopolyspora alba TaxID=648780 RepID=A0A2P8DX98_9ACTN|nr:CU044_5270 family protein [Haloactinopolyspora alba]PSL01849.1 hypothetical protein CLV30_11288 [Haloactinopolyspora alba]